jgi:hypothetical protein
MPRQFPRLSAVLDDAVTARIAAGGRFRPSCLTGLELGRTIAQNALANYLRPVPHFADVTRKAGEFQLFLSPGRSLSYVIETSSDLAQWVPWQTNVYGAVLHTDSTPSADRRFYRTSLQTLEAAGR